jgi:hypothetical protein
MAEQTTVRDSKGKYRLTEMTKGFQFPAALVIAPIAGLLGALYRAVGGTPLA